MSRRLVLRIALTLLIVPTSAVVASPQPPVEDQLPRTTIRNTIEDLLKQLDSPQLATRTRAERSLVDLGPEALTYLPAPELTPSASVRETVKRIRVQLERRAAQESARTSRMELSGDVTVAQLLKEFANQTRNRIELADGVRSMATQSVHVEFLNQPFWECLDQVCGQLKLEPVFDFQRGAISLQPRSPRKLNSIFVQRTGPVRIAVQSVEVRPIAGNAVNRLLRVSARVTLEPRLRPLFLHFAASDLQAFDSTGRQLEAWNSAATYELPVGDAGREVSLQLDFLLPKENESSSIDVRGTVSIQLAAGTEGIVFDQTSQTPGTMRRRGGVTVQLREVKFEPQENGKLNAAIGVVVSYDTGGPAFESHRTWMFHNAVYLETESRRKTDFTDYDTSQQTNGSVGVDYRWEQLAPPPTQYHFVYEAPTLILDLPVALNLEKVPIAQPEEARPASPKD